MRPNVLELVTEMVGARGLAPEPVLPRYMLYIDESSGFRSVILRFYDGGSW